MPNIILPDLLLYNKDSERMLLKYIKLICRINSFMIEAKVKRKEEKTFYLVYSESHTNYLYSSIYYIEIIWVLYFQLNSELRLQYCKKKKKRLLH